MNSRENGNKQVEKNEDRNDEIPSQQHHDKPFLLRTYCVIARTVDLIDERMRHTIFNSLS